MGKVGALPDSLLIVNKDWKFVIVKAQFNQHITDKLLSSALKRFEELGVSSSQVTVVTVPGALEVPLAIEWALAESYDGAIALGAVIRGETTHYEYVCNGVERGCMSIQIKSGKPIAQAVLTVETEAQALDRCGGAHGDKGAESVEVVVSMLNVKAQLK